MTRLASLVAFPLATVGWAARAMAQQSEFYHGPAHVGRPVARLVHWPDHDDRVPRHRSRPPWCCWSDGCPPTAQSQAAPPSAGPLDILKTRFARGEIDKNEYEERRRVLEP